jgi:hypothetical protein
MKEKEERGERTETSIRRTPQLKLTKKPEKTTNFGFVFHSVELMPRQA